MCPIAQVTGNNSTDLLIAALPRRVTKGPLEGDEYVANCTASPEHDAEVAVY